MRRPAVACQLPTQFLVVKTYLNHRHIRNLNVNKRITEMKRTRLTNKQKLEIIDDVKAEVINKKQAMQKYNIDRRTFWKIIKNEKSIRELTSRFEMKEKKANKLPNDKMLEEAVTTWLYQTRELGGLINGPIIQQKALNFYERLEAEAQNRDIVLQKGKNRKFVASEGWLSRFKKRHGIRTMNAKGEILSSDIKGTVRFQEEFLKRINIENLKFENIYNADESGINYKSLFRTTLASYNETLVQGDELKDRITALFCCNATGSHKLNIFCIGKSTKPRDIEDVKNLPVIYSSQKNSWMDRAIFLDWFTNHFIPDIEKHQKEQNIDGKVILLLDKAPSHPSLTVLNAINEKFEVAFLPPNRTATIQPLDQGLISLTKKCYKRKITEYIYSDCTNKEEIIRRAKKINLKLCFDKLSEAWDSLESSTVHKAWKPLLGHLVLPDIPSTIEFVDPALLKTEESSVDNTEFEENKKNWMSDDSQEQFSQDDCIAERILQSVENSDGSRQNIRNEILEWLENDEGDMGWEPLSDAEIISVVTREHGNFFPANECIWMKVSHLEDSTDFSNITLAENAYECLNAFSWLETQKEIAIPEDDLIVVRRLKKIVQGHVTPETCAENNFINL